VTEVLLIVKGLVRFKDQLTGYKSGQGRSRIDHKAASEQRGVKVSGENRQFRRGEKLQMGVGQSSRRKKLRRKALPKNKLAVGYGTEGVG